MKKTFDERYCNLLKKEGIKIEKGKIDLKKYCYYFKGKSL